MKQLEEITFQTLADNEDIQIGYSDNDIVVVDSIQQFAEVKTAHVAMNAVVICTNGKIQAQMNGIQMELHKNQVAIVPQNVTKMNIWNDMMYIHRHHIVTMDEDEMLFYTHFYDMLTLAITKGDNYPLKTEVIQSLLRAAILGLCGGMKKMLSADTSLANADALHGNERMTSKAHFQHFLDLLHSKDVKRHTVEDYASELCISPKYLTAVCKKNSGKTANETSVTTCVRQISASSRYATSSHFPTPLTLVNT